MTFVTQKNTSFFPAAYAQAWRKAALPDTAKKYCESVLCFSIALDSSLKKDPASLSTFLEKRIPKEYDRKKFLNDAAAAMDRIKTIYAMDHQIAVASVIDLIKKFSSGDHFSSATYLEKICMKYQSPLLPVFREAKEKLAPPPTRTKDYNFYC